MEKITFDEQAYTLIEGKKITRNNVYAFYVSVLKHNKSNEYYLEIYKEDDYNHKNQVITIPMSMLTKILPHIMDASFTYGIFQNSKDGNNHTSIIQHRPSSLLNKHPENRWEEISSMIPKIIEASTFHAKADR